MFFPVRGHTRPEGVVVGAVDDGDGVDLDIAQLLDAALHGGLAGTEGRIGVQALGDEGDAAGLGDG